eukprot:TRINITY_DN7614_c0_g1_i1.p1 TRINITY_DN7614_c0_g1~~TRINITY_DN7614_c0_g1_i1.p1  ORF type:complete len:234 (-),score=10.60 TRINITY_DN7614_c0_g1_i1:35-736(-)
MLTAYGDDAFSGPVPTSLQRFGFSIASLQLLLLSMIFSISHRIRNGDSPDFPLPLPRNSENLSCPGPTNLKVTSRLTAHTSELLAVMTVMNPNLTDHNTARCQDVTSRSRCSLRCLSESAEVTCTCSESRKTLEATETQACWGESGDVLISDFVNYGMSEDRHVKFNLEKRYTAHESLVVLKECPFGDSVNCIATCALSPVTNNLSWNFSACVCPSFLPLSQSSASSVFPQQR